MALRRILRQKKMENIDPLRRILMTTHVEKVDDLLPLLHKADYFDDIHAEMRRRWKIQKRINWSKGYDRWYQKQKEERQLADAKKADKWPRWFWKYWHWVDKDAWDSYMEWKEETNPQKEEE